MSVYAFVAAGAIFLCGILSVGTIVGGLVLRGQSQWVPLAGSAAAAAVMAVPVVPVRSVRYRISNYRIDYELGVFSRDIDTLDSGTWRT